MSNDASGIHDELTVELTRSQVDIASEDEGVAVDIESSDPVVSDGLISIDENVLAHLLNYHNPCTACNLNQILNRRAE